MADSTTFGGGGGDIPLFVAEKPRRRERAHIDTLRARVRELGLDIKSNWSEAGRPPEPQAVRAERTARKPASAEWVDRLASEYREDIAVQARRAPAPAPVEDEAVHPLASGAYAAGRAAFALDGALRPPAVLLSGLLSSYGGLALKGLLGALLLLAGQGLLRDWPKPAEPASPRVRPVAWVEIAKPYPLFDLSAPLFGHAPPLYSARRHAAGGGREDVLTFGQFGGVKPFLRLGVYRHGTEDVAASPYFVDMARRASVLGLGVSEVELPQALPTRFGDLESGGLELSGPEGVRRANCRGFRLEIATPALTMGGFMCGAGEDALSPADLVCAVDRLDLVSAGQDRALADFFGAASGRKSRACADSPRRK